MIVGQPRKDSMTAADRSTLPSSGSTLGPAGRVKSFRAAWSSYLSYGAFIAVVLVPPLIRGLTNGAADGHDWRDVGFWVLVAAAWILYQSRFKLVLGPDHISYFSPLSFFSGPESLRYSDIERYDASAIYRGLPAKLQLIPKRNSGRRPVRINLRIFGREQISEMLALLHARVPHAAPSAAPPAGASAGSPASALPPAHARKPWQVRPDVDPKWILGVGWVLLAAVSAYAGLAHGAVLIPEVFFLLSALGVGLYFLLRPKYDFAMASNQEVRSALGFGVRLDPPRLLYSEDNRVITLTAQELPASASGFSVSDGPIRAWDPPFQHEGLSRRRAARIRKNIAAAMAFLRAQRERQGSPPR
jgi:hypothetical protein